MHKRKIFVSSSLEYFEMIISIPDSEDDEEHIDWMLEQIIKPEIYYYLEWDFID